MNCKRIHGQSCPASPCLGESNPAVCSHLKALSEHRTREFHSGADGVAQCTGCPRAGRPCLGQRLPHLCNRPEYREYLKNRDPDGPGDAPTNPSLLEMVKGAVGSLIDHVADGGRKAPPGVQADRLAICQACPHFDPTMPSCRLCGCGSVIKGGLELKLSLGSSACPDDPPRWDKLPR